MNRLLFRTPEAQEVTIKPLWIKPLYTCLVLACLVAAIVAIPHSGTSGSFLSNPVLAASDNPTAAAPVGWDRQAPERYLDSREVWWQSWDRAQKDHGTYCISCHTQASYGLARPVLRQASRSCSYTSRGCYTT